MTGEGQACVSPAVSEARICINLILQSLPSHRQRFTTHGPGAWITATLINEPSSQGARKPCPGGSGHLALPGRVGAHSDSINPLARMNDVAPYKASPGPPKGWVTKPEHPAAWAMRSLSRMLFPSSQAPVLRAASHRRRCESDPFLRRRTGSRHGDVVPIRPTRRTAVTSSAVQTRLDGHSPLFALHHGTLARGPSGKSFRPDMPRGGVADP